MIIAQISDLHIGFDRATPDEANLQRLNRVLDRILALSPRPDLLIASGDLTEHGDEHSYRVLARALARMPMPVHMLVGNHDLRAGFFAAFPDAPRDADSFVQQVIEEGALRLILIDTLEEGRHGGAFCERRAAWLAARLAEAPERPTMLFLHHPPQTVGIPWMDPNPAEPWIARLKAVLAGQRQLVAIASGHVHLSVQTSWAGFPVVTCPSTAPEVGLVLAPLDPDRPDDRPLIEGGDPAFALHVWDGERLVTHFGGCPDATLARFEPRLQPMIAAMMAERRIAS